MADHFVALDLIKTSSSASDQTLAGPAQGPSRAVETAQMSEPATRTTTISGTRRPTQPGPSDEAPGAMAALFTSC